MPPSPWGTGSILCSCPGDLQLIVEWDIDYRDNYIKGEDTGI